MIQMLFILKEMIHYFRCLDDSYNQLDPTYKFYKNPIFTNSANEVFIGILDPQFDLTFGKIYTCNFELVDLPSPNPRIRNKYYYGRLKECTQVKGEVYDLFVD